MTWESTRPRKAFSSCHTCHPGPNSSTKFHGHLAETSEGVLLLQRLLRSQNPRPHSDTAPTHRQQQTLVPSEACRPSWASKAEAPPGRQVVVFKSLPRVVLRVLSSSHPPSFVLNPCPNHKLRLPSPKTSRTTLPSPSALTRRAPKKPLARSRYVVEPVSLFPAPSPKDDYKLLIHMPSPRRRYVSQLMIFTAALHISASRRSLGHAFSGIIIELSLSLPPSL